MKKPYLLFDAGGTLVFPNMPFLRDTAEKYSVKVTEDDVFCAYCELIFEIDLHAKEHGILPEPYPRGVGWAFFEKIGLEGKALTQASKETTVYNEHENLWAFTYPWVSDALDKLQKQGYRMSVLSNADGRVEQLLKSLGLAKYFEHIFDSHILGVEKPNPKIFQIALKELNLLPEQTLYIGDVFCIDAWGANNVGIPAVHLDPLGLYQGWEGARVTSVAALSNALEQCVFQKDAFLAHRG